MSNREFKGVSTNTPFSNTYRSYSVRTRLFFLELITLLDDYGRKVADVNSIQAALLADVAEKKVESAMDLCRRCLAELTLPPSLHTYRHNATPPRSVLSLVPAWSAQGLKRAQREPHAASAASLVALGNVSDKSSAKTPGVVGAYRYQTSIVQFVNGGIVYLCAPSYFIHQPSPRDGQDNGISPFDEGSVITAGAIWEYAPTQPLRRIEALKDYGKGARYKLRDLAAASTGCEPSGLPLGAALHQLELGTFGRLAQRYNCIGVEDGLQVDVDTGEIVGSGAPF